MFQLLRFAKRVAENPKILIPVIAFIIIGFALDHFVFAAPSNPLPAPDQVQQVSYSSNPEYNGSEFQSLEMKKYTELWKNLEGAKRIFVSGGGELSAILKIQTKDGAAVTAKLYDYGLVQTTDGTFEGADDETSNKLYSAIYDISNRY